MTDTASNHRATDGLPTEIEGGEVDRGMSAPPATVAQGCSPNRVIERYSRR